MDALSRPWFLARFVTGVVAAVLCLVAVWVAVRVLRRWRVGATSEGQLALERRAELVATLVQGGLMLALTSLALTVLVADRSADAIRGAMCAWGVFESTDIGFWPVATSALSALACALWLVLHRLDLRLETPVLTRSKFVALFTVAPLVWLDLGVFGAFATQLDFDVVASCCSVSLDGGALQHWGTQGSGASSRLFYLALALAVGAGASLSYTRRRPSRIAALASALLSLAAALAMIPAVLLYVAPHVYETPHHLCPFCLLHADVGGIGWPLFGALFGGTALGAGTGLVALVGRHVDAPEAVADLERTLGRWGALSWLTVSVLALAPIVRFSIIGRGASLFP